MLNQFRNITLVFLVLTGFILMGTTCFQHTDNKTSHAILKASSHSNFELVAEMEEDEAEQEAHLYFDILPFLHFLYENNFNKDCKSALLVNIDSSPNQSHDSFQSKICVFRI